MTREQELSFSILCSQNGWHKARIQEARDEIRNLIEQQAKQIEKQTVLIEALDADRKYLRGLIRDVFIELEEDDNNGPGHDHKKRGVWDSDNASGIAGKPCEWCRLWDLVRIEALK